MRQERIGVILWTLVSNVSKQFNGFRVSGDVWRHSQNCYLSTATATAFPPPKHNAAIPRCTSCRIIS